MCCCCRPPPSYCMKKEVEAEQHLIEAKWLQPSATLVQFHACTLHLEKGNKQVLGGSRQCDPHNHSGGAFAPVAFSRYVSGNYFVSETLVSGWTREGSTTGCWFCAWHIQIGSGKTFSLNPQEAVASHCRNTEIDGLMAWLLIRQPPTFYHLPFCHEKDGVSAQGISSTIYFSSAFYHR